MSDLHVRIEETIFTLLSLRSASATLCPSEVARALAPTEWRALMPHVRAAAVALAHAGRIEIRQHGKPVGTDSKFTGPIRLGLTKQRT